MDLKLPSQLHFPFIIIVTALFIFFVGTQLVQDGMFMDGLLYVSVAKNLGNGWGRFWNPAFSETLYPSYHQQPPLMLFIESLFFRVLGTGMYVERIYCVVVLLITSFLMVRIWKALVDENQVLQKFWWFPLLLFILIPGVGWSYSNNMAEGTMGIFDLLSVLFIIKAVKRAPAQNFPLLYLFLAGCAIFLASLCKGIQGMFPLAAVLLYSLATRRISFAKSLWFTAALVAAPLLLYGLLLLDETAVQSFKDYLDARLLPTFTNATTATTANRFHLVRHITLALLPVASLCLLIIVLRKRIISSRDNIPNLNKEGIWMLFIALSGSVPLLATLEQRGFYMVTAMPYFVFAFSCFAVPHLAALLQRWQPSEKSLTLFQAVAVIIFAASVITCVLLSGNTRRDKELLSDIRVFGAAIPEKTVIKVSDPLWYNWRLHGYFMRYFDISLYAGEKNYPFLVLENGCSPPQGYEQVKEGGKMQLYRLKGD